jgi:hypothetical protein
MEAIITREDTLKIEDISAQYNPARFKYWKSLHKGAPNDVLNIRYSPHVRFLEFYNSGKLSGFTDEEIKDTSYYKMHQAYGKSHKWTMNKITKFVGVFEDISKNGMKEPPVILERPMHTNPFNSGYEIYEGHHRVAIQAYLGAEKMRVSIAKYEKA